MANSLMIGCSKVGVDFVIIAPKNCGREKNWLLCVKGTQKKPVPQSV